jgi:SAM-dependent methyltransferase
MHCEVTTIQQRAGRLSTSEPTVYGSPYKTVSHPNQQAIDAANASWWNELCGSSAARAWGVTDASIDSLRRYDHNFLRYYPYLDRHIPWPGLRGKHVLEVGLGYGTVSQKLAESGAFFTGIDIAPNPVALVNHRLRQSGLAGEAIQANILTPPFAEGSFDAIVAIGCLHHTGNLGGAIASCRRLLRPGGLFVGMVYYAYSYRRLWNEPWSTIRQFIYEFLGDKRVIRGGRTGAYDSATDNSLAPLTDFVSIRSLRSSCDGFIDFRARTENANQEVPFSRWTRDALLSSSIPKVCGLDLYWSCTRAATKLSMDC